MASGGADPVKKRKAAAGPLPSPLVPPECNLSGYPSMMLDIGRLRQSDFDATPDDGAWRAGFNLWFSAWESVPASSLRSDDASLAKAAGLGRDVRSWARVKVAAMRGFVLCSDGRVYHRTVAEQALGTWIDKLIRRGSGQVGNRGKISDAERSAAVAEIQRQICSAAAHLRALNSTAPALTKTARHEAQCARSPAQCDRNALPDAGALGPQGNKGNEVEESCQEGKTVVVDIREARA